MTTPEIQLRCWLSDMDDFLRDLEAHQAAERAGTPPQQSDVDALWARVGALHTRHELLLKVEAN
jgi:hypothetical protein